MRIATAWNATEPLAAAPGAESVIRRNLRVEGKLSFHGSLLVEGEIRGSVISEDNVESLLTLSETGVIEGEVRVASAVISGQITGNVRSTQQLSLTATAVIRGDVEYQKLEIAHGAVVEGRLIFEGEPGDPVVA